MLKPGFSIACAWTGGRVVPIVAGVVDPILTTGLTSERLGATPIRLQGISELVSVVGISKNSYLTASTDIFLESRGLPSVAEQKGIVLLTSASWIQSQAIP